MREARERRSVKLQGIEEVGFKEELRFELVYDVALGIGELAQEASLDALGAAPSRGATRSTSATSAAAASRARRRARRWGRRLRRPN